MTPTPTTAPKGFFPRYLLHPGPTTSVVLHRLLHELASIGRVVIPIVVAIVAAFALATLVSWFSHRKASTGRARLVLIAPGPDVDPNGAEVLWGAMHGILRRGGLMPRRPHVSFEITWADGRLLISIWVPTDVSSERVAHAVQAAWPGATTEVVLASSTHLLAGHGFAAGDLHLAQREWFPIRTDHRVEPLRMLFGAIASVESDHTAVIQVLARPAAGRRLRRCRKAASALRTGRSMSKVANVIDFWMTKGVPSAARLSADPTRSSDIRVIGEKSASQCFEVAIHYGVAGADASSTTKVGHSQLRSEAHGLVSAFALYDGRNHLARRRLSGSKKAIRCRRLGRSNLLSVPELAGMAHLPTDRGVAGLSRAGAHVVAPPPEVHSTGKVLGRSELGDRRKVGLEVHDARQHVHILGSTGSGKSTLITNLVLDDVAAGRGAVVVDPKGDLIDDIIDRLPEKAAGRVVILDPDDDAAPPAMNVLGAADPYLAVDHLVGIFHRLFEAYWGPRTDDVLRVAALTAVRQPGATLGDIPLLLTDAGFRSALTKGLDDPNLKGFWSAYEKMSPGAQTQMVGPVMNKLRTVLTRPFVSAVLTSSASSFDLGADVLDGGLLLARLPKGTLGDDSCRLLGSFVVAKVWQAVTARGKTSQVGRVDASIYLDECQNFLTLPGSMTDMLAEARGYRLSIVAAHQNLAQLPRELQEALSANARNKMYFTCSPEDARILERHVAPELSQHDLSHLGAHQAAARLVVDFEEAPAFTLRTEAAPDVAGNGPMIRRAAREQFGRSADQRYDESLRRRMTGRRGAGARGSSALSSGSGPDADFDDTSDGSPSGRSLGSSPGSPDAPGSPWAKHHQASAVTPADDDPDSWSDL
jgi:hypothetical protein